MIEGKARERNGEYVARNRRDGINKNKRLATRQIDDIVRLLFASLIFSDAIDNLIV